MAIKFGTYHNCVLYLQPASKGAQFFKVFERCFLKEILKNILSDKINQLPLHSRYKNGQRKTLKDL